MQTGLVVETGFEAHEVRQHRPGQHGADDRYLAFETLERSAWPCGSIPGGRGRWPGTTSRPSGEGILKVMSKMGISTYQSYCGAQIFDAVELWPATSSIGISPAASAIGDIGTAELAEECVRRHRDAYGAAPIYRDMLDVGGLYAFRLRGEEHAWSPQAVADLQRGARRSP